MSDLLSSFDVVPGTATERLVSARPGSYQLGLVLKKTYQIAPNGQLSLSDEVTAIEEEFPEYEPDLPPPQSSPPRWDNDLFAFKDMTDVVVQGHAYSYGRSNAVETELRVGPIQRGVRVHGERRAEWRSGRIEFSPAEPFERIPLRYDRAYGGFDAAALEREGDPTASSLERAQPAISAMKATRFHYPRNPTGRGYLMRADRESVERALVPNLEFPFDPVTPDRLAVGGPLRWLSAPLPAGYDWFHPTWFPRLAYMGLVPEHEPPPGEVAEAAQGWVPREILTLRGGRLLFFDPRFGQGASPGLSVQGLAADAELVLRNVFPSHPERRVRLPGEQPKVTISIVPGESEAAETRLASVVIQPDEDRAVLVYVARRSAPRQYAPMELAAMKWRVD